MNPSSTLSWLLEKGNPSVRFFALTQLLEKPLDDPEVQQAHRAIMDSPLIAKLLSTQNPDGSWGLPERFYTDKYEGTVWNLILLAELGADGNDPRVKAACEFVLFHSQDPESGGFAHASSAKTGHGLSGSVVPCLTGNMVYSLIRLGYLHDPRVQKAIAWIVRYQRTDDGVKTTPEETKYAKLYTCFGQHTCHMGAAKALKALAEIPEHERSIEVKTKIDQLTEYFLIHHIHKKSHDLSQDAKPGWKSMGFPLMYNTDILEMLHLFAKIKKNDPRIHDAMEVLIGRQNEQGQWLLQNTFNDKMRISIEKKGQPSKWLTLKALQVLKEFAV
mgnify:FL=1